MSRVIEKYTFLDGKRLYKDRLEYASGDFVLFSEHEKEIALLDAKIHTLQEHIDNQTNELDQMKKENEALKERISELPSDPIGVANMIINAKCKYKHSNIGKIIYGHDETEENVYSIDDLEQIAEHLMVYCKHNRED